MEKLQFRVLYRQFLFRMVDLELLSTSAHGDISGLLGRIAGLLVFFSFGIAFGALLFNRHMRPELLQAILWSTEHRLISTTMLVVGLFSVLSWDSIFPDRRDVLVLAPLPIRARTLFLAKIAAAGTALGFTVVALHCLAGFAWPFHFVPAGGGPLGAIRSLMAYWITMLSAGAFNFACVLGVQGVAAQLLPRRYFLRLSAFLQIAAFCLFVSMYFLEPALATPRAFAAPRNQRELAWLPSYWFLGFFHQLNGSLDPALAPLARRAWIGLAVAIGATAVTYALSYLRTLRKIVEEPDIVAGSRGINWLPRFGDSLQTAVVQFGIRTLARSRQHRVMLAFYLGIGFAMVLLSVNARHAEEELWTDRSPLLFASIVMMCFCVVGTRVVFSMPLDLRANWIFRMTEVRGAHEYMAAIRRPLFVLAVAPVWAASAALFFRIWPWRPAAEHLAVLGLWGIILGYVCLYGFQKIPFTCSYLSGKSNLQMAFFGGVGLLLLVSRGVAIENGALDDPGTYFRMLAILVIAAVCVRWRVVTVARSEEAIVQFEDLPTPAIQRLGLDRDGVVPVEFANDRR
jgi:hypothetical protein